MAEALRLLCVLAHPDDEALGMGSTLIKYARAGIETYLVTATRGERGWQGDEKDYPGLGPLGKTREAELRCAAAILGLREVNFLDYVDGEVDQAEPVQAIAKIAAHVRRLRPQVVITFPPDGVYGHPDHIAISQFTAAALVCAADPTWRTEGKADPAHRVSKLYYTVVAKSEIDAYQKYFGELTMTIDGVARGATAWSDWAITTRIPSEECARTAWEAIACHRSQLPTYGKLEKLSEREHRALWGNQCFYRAYSTVNAGRQLETDLFEGLR